MLPMPITGRVSLVDVEIDIEMVVPVVACFDGQRDRFSHASATEWGYAETLRATMMLGGDESWTRGTGIGERRKEESRRIEEGGEGYDNNS